MATELVQKNRKAISVYCTALRITGWLLIVGLVALVVGGVCNAKDEQPCDAQFIAATVGCWISIPRSFCPGFGTTHKIHIRKRLPAGMASSPCV